MDPRRLFDLSGRVALVTGAGRGIGARTAAVLAGRGARVAVNDLSLDRARTVAKSVGDAGDDAIAVTADVTDLASVTSMVQEVVERLGPVDILVNNAGVPASGFAMKEFTATERQDWDPYISINVYGVLNCTHSVVGSMVERGWGRVITIISDSARAGERLMAAYAASKAAAAGFSRALAKEVGRAGVTCNCISLGWVPHDAVDLGSDDVKHALRNYAVKRPGRPDDVAAAAVWLASTEASWVTGQTVPVNGGYVMT
ncbi:MAG: SDR family oxidoreductase [Pseudonocardia sp.]|nr:SDR family oxidoreductase [Pseudonocardia sp.]